MNNCIKILLTSSVILGGEKLPIISSVCCMEGSAYSQPEINSTNDKYLTCKERDYDLMRKVSNLYFDINKTMCNNGMASNMFEVVKKT